MMCRTSVREMRMTDNYQVQMQRTDISNRRQSHRRMAQTSSNTRMSPCETAHILILTIASVSQLKQTNKQIALNSTFHRSSGLAMRTIDEDSSIS